MFIEIEGHLFNVSDILTITWDTKERTAEVRFRCGHTHAHQFTSLSLFLTTKDRIIKELTK